MDYIGKFIYISNQETQNEDAVSTNYRSVDQIVLGAQAGLNTASSLCHQAISGKIDSLECGGLR